MCSFQQLPPIDYRNRTILPAIILLGSNQARGFQHLPGRNIRKSPRTLDRDTTHQLQIWGRAEAQIRFATYEHPGSHIPSSRSARSKGLQLASGTRLEECRMKESIRTLYAQVRRTFDSRLRIQVTEQDECRVEWATHLRHFLFIQPLGPSAAFEFKAVGTAGVFRHERAD